MSSPSPTFYGQGPVLRTDVGGHKVREDSHLYLISTFLAISLNTHFLPHPFAPTTLDRLLPSKWRISLDLIKEQKSIQVHNGGNGLQVPGYTEVGRVKGQTGREATGSSWAGQQGEGRGRRQNLDAEPPGTMSASGAGARAGPQLLQAGTEAQTRCFFPDPPLPAGRVKPS